MNMRFTEETLRSWTYPPSDSEEAKLQNAERLVKETIASAATLQYRPIKVFCQGSYANDTNIRLDSDIDVNGHVNSIRYIEHVLDLFPLDFYREKRVRRFEMAYVAESYYGDELTFYRDEAGEGVYNVEVRKNGSEVICRAKVMFTTRE